MIGMFNPYYVSSVGGAHFPSMCYFSHQGLSYCVFEKYLYEIVVSPGMPLRGGRGRPLKLFSKNDACAL